LLILDTHTLVWLDEGNEQLGRKSLLTIDQSLKTGELFISSISFWEISMLIGKGRLEIQMNLDLWRQNLLDNGLQEVPLSGDSAIQAGSLSNFHGDPADRMIVSTAINMGATLVTADKKILTWEGQLSRINAKT